MYIVVAPCMNELAECSWYSAAVSSFINVFLPFSPNSMTNLHHDLQQPTHFLNALSSPLSPTGGFRAPFAKVYNPLQSPSGSLLQRRHSTSSIPSQVKVGVELLKEVAQICPSSPVEVEVPGLKVRHIQFNSPLQLYSQKNILDSLQGQISSISPTFPR